MDVFNGLWKIFESVRCKFGSVVRDRGDSKGREKCLSLFMHHSEIDAFVGDGFYPFFLMYQHRQCVVLSLTWSGTINMVLHGFKPTSELICILLFTVAFVIPQCSLVKRMIWFSSWAFIVVLCFLYFIRSSSMLLLYSPFRLIMVIVMVIFIWIASLAI